MASGTMKALGATAAVGVGVPTVAAGVGYLNGGTLGAMQAVNGVANTAAGVATQAGDIISGIGGAVNGGIEAFTQPIIGAAAPFAAPMIAGAYLGKKLVDYSGTESKFMKGLATVGGAAVGGALATSVATPYLTAAAAGVLLAKPAITIGKGIGKGVSGLAGGATGFIWGGVKGAGLGSVRSAKKRYQEPGIFPDVGFA